MLFHTPEFIVFLLLLLIPFYLWRGGRLALLVAANILFYAASGLGVLVLFIVVTCLTFFFVHMMRRSGFSWLFWLGIAVNVGNLVFFKYTMLLIHTAEAIVGDAIPGAGLIAGWLTGPDGRILMVTGISFYTFQLLSYLIDVRRGLFEPTRSLARFWIYIALFPALIAGPIMRGQELIPQLDGLKQRHIRWDEIRFGLYLIFIGLMKKVLLADNIEGIAAPLFGDVASLSPEQSWIAAYLFGFQIYFDFSAYSDMALGIGYLLGIKLVVNFKTPFLSSNPSEFWTRWHISLSRWIRDYVYIGLGGNRKGETRTIINLFAAMVISGIWHGAMWHFVLWGAVHGLLLIVYRWSLRLNVYPWIDAIRSSGLYRAAAIVVFFHIVTWTWVFFRAESVGDAWALTGSMLQADPVLLLHEPWMPLVVALFALHIIEYFANTYAAKAQKLWHWIPAPLRGGVYALLVLVMFYYMKGESYEFIYFQF